MKKLLLIVPAVCALAFAVLSLPRASAQEGEAEREQVTREAWVLKGLREMEGVKVGMTRADLLKVFAEEGGLSTRERRTYVYRGCRYFKVDVKFKPVGEASRPFGESPDDEITEISRPYIDYNVLD